MKVNNGYKCIIMRCERCNGYMYNERVYTQMGNLDVCICANCGNVEDELIIFHRIVAPLLRESPQLTRPE